MSEPRHARQDAWALITAWSMVPDADPTHEIDSYLERHGACGVATALVVWLDCAVRALGGQLPNATHRVRLSGIEVEQTGTRMDAAELGREMPDAKWCFDLVCAHMVNDGVELRRLISELAFHETPNHAMTQLLMVCGMFVNGESEVLNV